MTELTQLLQRLIEQGADPNDLQKEFKAAVVATLEWGLWGDNHWRRNTVCSKCGSSNAGICADKGTELDFMDFDNPAFHKNQLGVNTIPYKDWLKRQEVPKP